MRIVLGLTLLMATRLAHAGEATSRSDEPSAADVQAAPLPGDESGRTDQPGGDSVLRDIGQGVLTVPRLVLVTAMAPVRTGIWVYDRYRLSDRFNQAFFDRTSTYGIYPTVAYESAYGVNVGGRAVHRNMFGAREKLQLRGARGGQFRALVDGSLHSGTRFGSRVSLALRAEYERRPRDPWYGIGNMDGAPGTRYGEELKRVSSYVDVVVVDGIVARTTGALTDRVYGPSPEGTPIDAVYDTSMLTGFSGVENLYGELELRWDRRGREATPGRHQIYDRGTMLSAFGGRVHQLQAGNDYWRYGGEAQGFIGLGVGPRSLMTRVHVEAVTGQESDVVFNQLPALGGSSLLRGYAPARFRDRAAVVGTAEYFWGLGQMFLASAFVDVGRVYPSLADFSRDNVRLGYGASLQLHGNRQFIAGVTVASSIDGGVFVNLNFDPSFDYIRAERR